MKLLSVQDYAYKRCISTRAVYQGIWERRITAVRMYGHWFVQVPDGFCGPTEGLMIDGSPLLSVSA